MNPRETIRDLGDRARAFRAQLSPDSPLYGPSFRFSQLCGKIEAAITTREIERQRARENDPRWLLVNDDTVVIWDGEPRKWRDLAGCERIEVDMTEDGRLVGSYPW
jgi:hypothetical protein